MEVGKISQGGQVVFDNIGTKDDTQKAAQGEAVKNDSVEVNKTDKVVNTDVVSEKDLKNALDKLTKFIEDDDTKVEYQFHNKFNNDLMIKIIDKKTKEVVLEVPPKKILDLVAKMMEMVGVLFDKKA